MKGIPKHMKAATMNEFGPPKVVHVESVPVPDLGKNDILVHVATAGVGTWDPDLVDGSFQDVEERFPRVLGSDGAGTVVATGKGVERFEPGDHVYGWGFGNPKGGFFAEYAVLPEKDAAVIPDNLAFEEAGALAVSGITALQGLEELELDAGDKVIIFGASGGVGHIALQLARRQGLHVFAVASKPDGVRLAKRLGADHVVEGRSKSLIREARAFAPDGFAGALVFAGGNGWKKELELVARGGGVASPNGVDPRPIVPRGVKLHTYDGEDSPDAFGRLNALIRRGPFHVELSKVYPLDATARALEDVRQHHVGKLAIRI